MTYKSPKLREKSFTCPCCNVIAEQKWNYIPFIRDNDKQVVFNKYHETGMINGKALKAIGEINISTCWNCYNYHIWVNDKMLIPDSVGIQLPIEGMPDKVKEIYNEARNVYSKSYKSAAALLRLAVQYLCKELGEEGKNINIDISNLVKKGLTVEVQQALDIIRVTGNNAVHPGTIDFEDEEEVSIRLFSLLNFIVERMIVQPQKIEKMFNWLPSNALNGIKNRDGK